MFATAQTVSSPVTGQLGTNSFLYRHDAAPPGIDWRKPDLECISSKFPGRLVSADTELPPGGNRVHAWLDVAASESCGVEGVRRVLQELARAVQASPAVALNVDGVAVRFETEGVWQSRAPAQVHLLSDRIIRILKAVPTPEWLPAEPIVVRVKREPEGRVFMFDEASSIRLKSLHRAPWAPSTVTLNHEAASAKSSAPSDVFIHLAPVLTGFPLDALSKVGGIRYVDADTSETQWEWPSRAELTGYCVGCHQHGTLRWAGAAAGFRCSNCGNEQDTDGLWVATLQ